MHFLCTLLFLLLAIYTSAQNNYIFSGGSDDGVALQPDRVLSATNLRGGPGDGYVGSAAFEQQANAIFAGSFGDGNADLSTEQMLNNQIYTGAGQDGADLVKMFSPGAILLSGGSEDGYASAQVSETMQNQIYSGTYGDGFVCVNAEQATTNPIFGGTYGDGVSQYLHGLHARTAIWFGTNSTEWNQSGNWFRGQIPTIDHVVLVNSITRDPALYQETLGIGFQNALTDRFAKELYVFNQASIAMIDARLQIGSRMEVYGMVNITLHIATPPVIVYSRGLLKLIRNSLMQIHDL